MVEAFKTLLGFNTQVLYCGGRGVSAKKTICPHSKVVYTRSLPQWIEARVLETEAEAVDCDRRFQIGGWDSY